MIYGVYLYITCVYTIFAEVMKTSPLFSNILLVSRNESSTGTGQPEYHSIIRYVFAIHDACKSIPRIHGGSYFGKASNFSTPHLNQEKLKPRNRTTSRPIPQVHMAMATSPWIFGGGTSVLESYRFWKIPC